MISDTNPVSGGLQPSDIERSGLVPRRFVMRNGRTINVFADDNIGLVKMDFIFEAGTALQSKKLQAAAAIHLITEGTQHHTSYEIAEFFDFRGLIVEKSNDEVSSTLTVYGMPRYLDELLPLIKEMILSPTYPQEEFDVFISKRKQQLMTNFQRTSFVARKRFYECLYGTNHPLGQYALPEELDQLTVQDVKEFHDKYLTLSRMSIVLGGTITDRDLTIFDDVFGIEPVENVKKTILPEPSNTITGIQKVEVKGAVQNTLRVGRRLPFKWNDVNYSRFMILSTVLGGYFGSRLMSNIREEKGYTYGINAMTQMYRGSIVFYITADVASDKAELALNEIIYELERLRNEPVGMDEFELVRRCMLGDFMRSVDGVFERSERFCQMKTNDVTELFTDNYMSVLESDAVTSENLCNLANSILDPKEMLIVNAGRVSC